MVGAALGPEGPRILIPLAGKAGTGPEERPTATQRSPRQAEEDQDRLSAIAVASIADTGPTDGARGSALGDALPGPVRPHH